MQLFLSDLHLESEHSRAFSGLRALLRAERHRCEAIYFLGDLVEVWVGDDDDGPLAQALLSLLTETARHCPIFIMHGNRDFLLGARFCELSGSQLLSDPTLLSPGILLAHGDAFCTDDNEYQNLRGMFRSTDWQQQVLSQSLVERRQLALGLRSASRHANANKAANIMDVNSEEVARIVRQNGASTLIHGHTHRPGIHHHDWGTRYVLGAWESCGWLLRHSEGQFQLECFRLPDHE
jgi:UDP-2,3-diacylglucosamine hydrolase